MSRTKVLLRGYGVQSVGQMVVLIANFAVVPVTIGMVGGGIYGLWAVCLQVLLFVGLVDFGVVSILPRELSRRLGQGAGDSEIREYIGRTFHLTLYFTTLALFIFGIGYWMLAERTPPSWMPLKAPVAVLMVAAILAFPPALFGYCLAGLHEVGYYWLCSTLQQLTTAGLTVLLLYSGCGVWSLTLGYLGGMCVLLGMFVVRFFAKHSHLMSWKLPAVWNRASLPILWAGCCNALNSFGFAVLWGLDLIVILTLLGEEAVTVYAITIKLAMTASVQIQSMIWSAIPALTDARHCKDVPLFQPIVAGALLCQAVLVGGVIVVILAINHSFVELWMQGRTSDGGWQLTAAFLGYLFFRQVQLLTTNILFSMGNNSIAPLTTLFEAALAALLMWSWIPILGMPGAPLAGIVATSAITLPVNFFLLSRKLKWPVKSILGTYGRWILWCTPLLLLATIVTWLSLDARSMVEHLAVIVVGILVLGSLYVVVMFDIVLKTPLGLYAESARRMFLRFVPSRTPS